MNYKIQLAPVGFEYKRILAGLKYRPSNMVYLLSSQISEENSLDSKLVATSEKFTQKLIKFFEETSTYEFRHKECSFIDYKAIIRNLCEIFREIFLIEAKGEVIEEISINLGTATKLFVSAAMFLSSYFVNKVKLFYIKAQRYTINLLLEEKKSKKEIAKIYSTEGNTFADDELSEYELVNVPLVQADVCPENAKRIIKALCEISRNWSEDWMKLQDILRKMGEPIDQSTKMKFRYHFKYLLDRDILEQHKHGRRRTYRFTPSGEVLAIIMSELGEFIATK